MKIDKQVVNDNKPVQQKNVALDLMKNILNKITEVLSYSKNNEKKLIQLHNENRQMLNVLQGFLSMNIKSQIPYMTPRQLASLYSRGWSIEEIVNVSGYTYEDVTKKIRSYKEV